MALTQIPEILGTAAGVTAVWLGIAVWPTQPFMKVHQLEVVGDLVAVERSVAEHPDGKTVADWRVTVVSGEQPVPSCQTKPGPRLHAGWSVYTPGVKKQDTMPLDIWVGDPGCYDTLAAGDYDMFVTWTPRDGGSPVTAKTSFTKGGGIGG